MKAMGDELPMLLVPRDTLHPRSPDPHFAEEAAAARELGIEVALVDHDALTRKLQRRLFRDPLRGGIVIHPEKPPPARS